MKCLSFITVLQNTEIARVVEDREFKGLILATKVWYEICVGFHFCDMYFFFAISKTDPA